MTSKKDVGEQETVAAEQESVAGDGRDAGSAGAAEQDSKAAEPAQPDGTAGGEGDPLAAQLLRLQADFENFRKRVSRERGEWFIRANEDLMRELLPALDHYEMGLDKARENEADKAVVEGFELIHGQITGALGKFGLKTIEIAGDPFDPHLHEAITYQPSASVPAEHVIEQTRRGYLLGDKLLRPAQVVVSSGAPTEV